MIVFAAIPLWTWDVSETDAGGMVTGESWEWGTASDEPFRGATGWSTGLVGAYWNDAEGWLEVPLPEITGLERPVLEVRHAYEILPGDLGAIEVRRDGVWVRSEPMLGYPLVAGFFGSSGGWTDSAIDLTGLGPDPAVRFYFSADALGAAAGWMIAGASLYDGDVVAPRIDPLDLPPAQTEPGVLSEAIFKIRDDTSVSRANLVWSEGGTERWIPMSRGAGDTYAVSLPAVSLGEGATWHIVADDGGNQSRWPVSAERTFRCALAAPMDLRGVGERWFGPSVRLSWSPPETVLDVPAYRVVDDSGYSIDTIETETDFPVVQTGVRTWSVAALVDGVPGTYSEPWSAFVEVPTMRSLSPSSAWPGQQVRVELVADGLYFDASMEEQPERVHFGEGVETASLVVVDAHRLRAILRVASTANPGPRTLSIADAFGDRVFDGWFVVGDSESAPHLVSLDPAVLQQGYDGALVVRVSEPFSGPVSVISDDQVLVSPGEPYGAVVELRVVVSRRARLGRHQVVLDDGQRFWEVEFVISEATVESGSMCNTSGGMAGFWSLIGVYAVPRRRARKASTLLSGAGGASPR